MSMRRNVLIVFGLLLSLTLGQTSRPNIVLILTDDLDHELGGMEPLVKTRSLIGEKGVTFKNAFATTPVCCPSRSSILTGRYLHNTGVSNNSISGNCGSLDWQRNQESLTFATALKDLGYLTFYAGKYLNQYGHENAGGAAHVPPGWDFWAGLVGNSKYYNYTLSINGKKEHHGDNYEQDYLTDVILKKAKSFLHLHSSRNISNPFLMVLAPPAPHAPFTPAPQYANRFANKTAPRTKAFNFVEDAKHPKHWFINTQPRPLNQAILDKVDESFRNRWRTLLSVDDMVEDVIQELDQAGELNNTFIIFTSDHGYHLGQFGLPLDKRQPYETDIRIPLLIRGPEIPPNSTSQAIVLNIDFAPTILNMSGIEPPKQMDGTSFLGHAKTPSIVESNDVNSAWSNAIPRQHSFLVEYSGEYDGPRDAKCQSMTDFNMTECSFDFGCKCQDARNNTYSCVRSKSEADDVIFCQFQDDVGFIEMYNLAEDQAQLFNIAYLVEKKVHAFYQAKIQDLKGCRGHSECFTP